MRRNLWRISRWMHHYHLVLPPPRVGRSFGQGIGKQNLILIIPAVYLFIYIYKYLCVYVLQLHITYWSEKKDEDLPELESMVLKRGGTYRLLVYPFSLSSSGVGIPELKKNMKMGAFKPFHSVRKSGKPK